MYVFICSLHLKLSIELENRNCKDLSVITALIRFKFPQIRNTVEHVMRKSVVYSEPSCTISVVFGKPNTASKRLIIIWFTSKKIKMRHHDL